MRAVQYHSTQSRTVSSRTSIHFIARVGSLCVLVTISYSPYILLRPPPRNLYDRSRLIYRTADLSAIQLTIAFALITASELDTRTILRKVCVCSEAGLRDRRKLHLESRWVIGIV